LNPRTTLAACGAALVLCSARLGLAQKIDPDGITQEQAAAALGFDPRALGTSAIPDIYGPGHVLSAGRLYVKVTNFGHVGNYFTNTSSDPAGQWPGGSGTEYLSTIRLAVGAKDPTSVDPSTAHRVSYFLEWRPPTLDPVDRIYEAYEGIPNGARNVNEDGDTDQLGANTIGRVDEEFLNGKDDDGDGKIDEDYATWGQQMFSWEMRDDTPQASNATYYEKHIPLGLECRQLAWCYSSPGNTDFDVFEYRIRNVSGHILDSLYVGFLVDLDAGPGSSGNYFQDDYAVPNYPSGEHVIRVDQSDLRYQGPPNQIHSQALEMPPCDYNVPLGTFVPSDSGLCPWQTIRVNGFSLVDGDGDGGQTPGAAMFLLLGHTLDYSGANAPSRTGFHSFRMVQTGVGYYNGGSPLVDAQRYELMASGEGIDPRTGFINVQPPAGNADYAFWCSVGPYLNVQPNQVVTVTTALAVANASRAGLFQPNGWEQAVNLAVAIQKDYDGVYEARIVGGLRNTDFHGRETALRAPPGQVYFFRDCQRFWTCCVEPYQQVDHDHYTFFNWDNDYCTGAWSPTFNQGYFLERWVMPTPPPNPHINLSAGYNFPDNPSRQFNPAGDSLVTLAWDNLPEYTPDPLTHQLDFKGYRIWKAANWRRPLGSAGPGEADWALQADYRVFDSRPSHCVRVYVPAKRDTQTLCMNRGDLVDWEHGVVLKADTTTQCVNYPACDSTVRPSIGFPARTITATHYPVGHWRYTDRRVLNGFPYFYAVTAYDSTYDNGTAASLEGRPYAVEADAVTPQTKTHTGKSAWVVPNPYRGHAGWDLTPSPGDPTGTHIDFMGMPPGHWTLRIYTLAGDLVEELHSTDPINQSQRPAHPNLQQDSPPDGQARWNMLSRNGQEIASGIYLYTVQSSQGTQVGKFVVIR